MKRNLIVTFIMLFFMGCDSGDSSTPPTASTDIHTQDLLEDTYSIQDVQTSPDPDAEQSVGNAPFRIATWNLDNFSSWGENENRLGAIAAIVTSSPELTIVTYHWMLGLASDRSEFGWQNVVVFMRIKR